MSKNSYQSSNSGFFENLNTTPPPLNSIISALNKLNEFQNINSTYQLCMKNLDQNYCLGSISSGLCHHRISMQSTQYNSRNQDRQSNEPPLQPDQPGGNSFHSSSSNKNSSDQVVQSDGKPNSLPVSHNESNKDWFNIGFTNQNGTNRNWTQPNMNMTSGCYNNFYTGFNTQGQQNPPY